MKFHPLIPALVAVTLAAPQEINFAAIDEQLPETTLVIPVTASPSIIIYDPTSARMLLPPAPAILIQASMIS